jgi:hypothetical protein
MFVEEFLDDFGKTPPPLDFYVSAITRLVDH